MSLVLDSCVYKNKSTNEYFFADYHDICNDSDLEVLSNFSADADALIATKTRTESSFGSACINISLDCEEFLNTLNKFSLCKTNEIVFCTDNDVMNGNIDTKSIAKTNILYVVLSDRRRINDRFVLKFPRIEKELELTSSESSSYAKILRYICANSSISEHNNTSIKYDSKVLCYHIPDYRYYRASCGIINNNVLVIPFYINLGNISELLKLINEEMKKACELSEIENNVIEFIYNDKFSRVCSSAGVRYYETLTTEEQLETLNQEYTDCVDTLTKDVTNLKCKMMEKRKNFGNWYRKEMGLMRSLLYSKYVKRINITDDLGSETKFSMVVEPEIKYTDFQKKDQIVEPGTYKIVISDSSYPYVEDFECNFKDAPKPHPHISDGNICYGTLAGTVKKAFEKREYAELALATVNLLNSYYENDAYIRMSLFTNGKYLDSKNYCESCSRRSSPFCIKECVTNKALHLFKEQDCQRINTKYCLHDCYYRQKCKIKKSCYIANTDYCHFKCPHYQHCTYKYNFCDKCTNFNKTSKKPYIFALCLTACPFNTARCYYTPPNSNYELKCIDCEIRNLCGVYNPNISSSMYCRGRGYYEQYSNIEYVKNRLNDLVKTDPTYICAHLCNKNNCDFNLKEELDKVNVICEEILKC